MMPARLQQQQQLTAAPDAARFRNIEYFQTRERRDGPPPSYGCCCRHYSHRLNSLFITLCTLNSIGEEYNY